MLQNLSNTEDQRISNPVLDRAMKHIFISEGGYVNHPFDKGGPTNMGITLATLRSWRGYDVTANDIKELTKEEATNIYKKKYWDIICLDSFKSDLLKILLMDQAVNIGTKTSLLRMQSCFNELTKPAIKLVEDGIIGPKTLGAINNFYDYNALGFEFVKATQLFYIRIIKRDRTQVVFLEGWVRRSHRLFDEVFSNQR